MRTLKLKCFNLYSGLFATFLKEIQFSIHSTPVSIDEVG